MCTISAMKIEELKQALDFIRSVFMQYEAPDYSKQGVDTFLEFIDIDSIRKGVVDGEFAFWVAKDGGKVVGALAMRNHRHICMLFVDGGYHRRGIARRLLKEAIGTVDGSAEITVNSSPYGADFYRVVGFVDTDVQKEVDGIVYIPMICRCGELKV